MAWVALGGPSQAMWLLLYSWIGPPVDAHETIISKRNERATTNPRPHAENFWQGASRSAWSSFMLSILTSFQNNVPNNMDQAEPDLPRQTLQYRGFRSF